MNNLLNRSGFKSLAVLLVLLISSVSVFAADNTSTLTNEPLRGLEVFLSFALLLFTIVAPAFKRRERTTFLSSNNEFFTI